MSEQTMARLTEIHRRLPELAAFSYTTAAWLHGLDLSPVDPIEVTVSSCQMISTRARANVHREILSGQEVVERKGLRTTSALRTACDLGRRLRLVEAVIALDMALHARLVTLAQLAAFVEVNPGRRGIARLRRAIALSEPRSESAMESRLRILLTMARLPRPQAQVPIYNSSGRVVARVDLFYPDAKLAIEYDGAGHRDRLAEDNRRQNALLQAGVSLLRYTAADVLGAPRRIAAEVRAELARRRRELRIQMAA
jgi:very-short-patch-repair endonuclease